MTQVKSESHDYDDLIDEAGTFGWFQVIIALLMGFGVALVGTHSTTFLFSAGRPDYRCYIEGCDNSLNSSLKASWVPNAIPPISDADIYQPMECTMYKRVEGFVGDACSKEAFLNETVQCEKWIFDGKERTIVNDYNLTCSENEWLLHLIGTTQCIAHLLGSLLGGDFSDRFGRKWTMIGCGFVMGAAGIAQSFAGNYMTFQITHFIQSIGVEGYYVVAFLICVESMGKKWRSMSGPIIATSFAIGEVLLGPAAYLERDWVYLKIYTSAPAFMIIFYYWIVPESVRWLMAKNRFYEAKNILIQIAKINNKTLSPKFYQYFDKQSTNVHNLRVNNFETNAENRPPEKPGDCLFRSKTMWIRTIILIYIWNAVALGFYGITFNSTHLGGNKYVDFSLVSLVEIPATIAAYWLLNILGRKYSLIASFSVTTLACGVATFLTSYPAAIITLSLIGKSAISACFPIIYVYTAELFPTAWRGYGVGICSTLARIGSAMAPMTSLLAFHYKWIMMLVYAITGLLGALAALTLPETKGKHLPETLKEAKTLDKKSPPIVSSCIETQERYITVEV